MCKNCPNCQELQAKQHREPMQMHERPAQPCVKLGTDLFEIDGQNFLIISDYFTCHPIVKQLPDTSANTVNAVTKEVFSMFGIPCQGMSDNGPQFLTAYDDVCRQWGIEHITSSSRHMCNLFVTLVLISSPRILRPNNNSAGLGIPSSIGVVRSVSRAVSISSPDFADFFMTPFTVRIILSMKPLDWWWFGLLVTCSISISASFAGMTVLHSVYHCR